MTHFMGFSMRADGKTVKQAKRIHTGKEHENVRVTLLRGSSGAERSPRPMRRDICTVPADEPVNWQALYDWCGAGYRLSTNNNQ